MKYLELIKYPLKLLFTPIAIPLWFILTDFRNDIDVENFKRLVIEWIKPF